MAHDMLYFIQEAKRHTQSPQLATGLLSTETDSTITISSWASYVNQAQQHLQNIVIHAFEDYLTAKQSITLTNGTSEITLNTNAIKIRIVERTDTTPDKKFYPINLSDKYDYDNTYNYPGYTSDDLTQWYSFWGKNLVIVPTPTASGTGQIWYIRRLADLSYGTAAAADATSITLATTATFGTTSDENDYYNNTRIKIISGTTGAGQIQEISDYVGLTKVCTTTWQNAITPTGTVIYSMLSDIPEEYDALIPVYAARLANISDEVINVGLDNLYAELKDQMIKSLENRQRQETREINFIGDPYYD